MNQPQRVSELTSAGIRRAKEYLAALRADENPDFPDLLLNDSTYARPVVPAVYVRPQAFANRREAGEHLNQCLAPLGLERIADNAGLWSWLGMFYFRQLVNLDPAGNPRLGRNPDVAYVIDPSDSGRGTQQRHRHRLLAAWEIYTRHGEKAWVMLEQPVSAMEQLTEYLMNKTEVFRSVGIVDLANRLYGDTDTRRPKTGFAGSGQNQRPPGGLRRLLDVMDQLYMTYDIYGMTAEQLIELLPPEFDRWRPSTATSDRPVSRAAEYRRLLSQRLRRPLGKPAN